MELRHLRYVLAVADELHFGRAAERLHMAQPPLSQQIRKLEEELGARLFERTSRAVCLTPAGAAFVAEARDILARSERAAVRARDIAAGLAGRLSVGYVAPALFGPFPQALRAFREAAPEVSTHLREASTQDLLKELRAGSLDIALLRLHRHDLDDLATDCFLREPYVAALPEGHPLIVQHVTPLAKLAAEPLIFYPRAVQPALFDAMLAPLSSAGGRPPVIAQEARTKLASLALVAAGLGWAPVPASYRALRHAGVVYRDIEPGLPLVELHAALPRHGASPVAERFFAVLRSFSEFSPRS